MLQMFFFEGASLEYYFFGHTKGDKNQTKNTSFFVIFEEKQELQNNQNLSFISDHS